MTHKGKTIENNRTERAFREDVLNSRMLDEVLAENFTKGLMANIVCTNVNDKRISL